MANHKQTKINTAGFTVVEIITAIVIMGIIIPSVASALTNLTVVDRQARDMAQANFIAQNEVENLRGIGYNAVNAGTTSFSSSLPSSWGSPKSASYTVTDGTAGGTPPLGVKQVDLSISYTEYGHTRQLSYRTYISELGVGQ